MFNIIIGIIAGICTGLGLGGSSVLILLLVLILNFDQRMAQATNIICFVPSALISILMNIKHKNIRFKLAFPIILFGIIGSIIGAGFSSRLDVLKLKKLFGIFLLLIALNEFYSLYKQYRIRKKRNTILYK